jgi:hypothetical protein
MPLFYYCPRLIQNYPPPFSSCPPHTPQLLGLLDKAQGGPGPWYISNRKQNPTSIRLLQPPKLSLQLDILQGNTIYRGWIQKKHGVWDSITELTITSHYDRSRVDSNTFSMGNPMPESTLTLYFIPPIRTLDLASLHCPVLENIVWRTFLDKRCIYCRRGMSLA